MTAEQQPDAHEDRSGETQPDPIDADAALIDARAPDAPELIEDLMERADDLGRDVDTDLEQALEESNEQRDR
jgi:hypothetical protein